MRACMYNVIRRQPVNDTCHSAHIPYSHMGHNLGQQELGHTVAQWVGYTHYDSASMEEGKKGLWWTPSLHHTLLLDYGSLHFLRSLLTFLTISSLSSSQTPAPLLNL